MAEKYSSKKVALITGATDGLGLEAAKRYLSAGFIVVITGRNQQKTDAALKTLKAVTGATDDNLRWISLDLSSFASVRKAAQDFLALDLPLHVLINNAGMISTSCEFTADTRLFEKTLVVNFVSPLLFTELLLPKLRESAPSRILDVTSSLHDPNSRGMRGLPAQLNIDNLDGSKEWDRMLFYKNSKLAIVWHTYLLSERLEGTGVTVNSFSPGFVPTTNLSRGSGFIMQFLMKNLLSHATFAVSADQSADEYLQYGTSPELEGVAGKYFKSGKETQSSKDSYNLEKAREVWNVACDAAGLEDIKLNVLN